MQGHTKKRGKNYNQQSLRREYVRGGVCYATRKVYVKCLKVTIIYKCIAQGIEEVMAIHCELRVKEYIHESIISKVLAKSKEVDKQEKLPNDWENLIGFPEL